MATKKAGPALVETKAALVPITAPIADGKQAHKTWTGQLAIGGALSVPVILLTAGREVGFSFNMLHGNVLRPKKDDKGETVYSDVQRRDDLNQLLFVGSGKNKKPVMEPEVEKVVCGGRLRQRSMYCDACGEDVSRGDSIKGYALDEKEGKYLHIFPEEIKACRPSSDKVMELLEFVDANEVPPVYIETSYYLSPDDKFNRKGFNTLWAAMREARVWALARISNSTRQHYVFLVPCVDDQGRPGMYAFYSFMADEIQQINFPSPVDTNPAEVAVARQVVEAMKTKFDPMKYHDEYLKNVEALLNAKQEGKAAPEVVERKAPAAEVSLEAAFKVALEHAKSRKAS